MLVHGYYPRDIRVRREAEALTEAGFRVYVICLRSRQKSGHFKEPSRERIKGVYVYRLPIARKRGTPLRYLFEYASLIILGAWKLIVVHLNSSLLAVHIHNMPDALISAGLIPKWLGAKLVLDIHDPMLEIYMQNEHAGRRRIPKKILYWQERWSRRLADSIITVNEPMRENIQEKGVSSDRILVVHNFPDTLYLPVKNDIASWMPHKDRLVWLYAGTITRQYRLDVAVQSLAIASSSLPPITLRLLGDGNDIERVLRVADDLGVRQCIEYLGSVQIDNLKNFMNDADIGISCSQAGPFGDLQFSLKVLDYLSQGLPVVCSRTKTLARYIPEDAVFYFEPDDAEDMAEKVIFMWNHPDVVKRKMENAKKLFPLCTWQKEKTKLIQFYRGLCNECPSTAE